MKTLNLASWSPKMSGSDAQLCAVGFSASVVQETTGATNEMKALKEPGLHEDARYKFSELTSRIIACAIEVHKMLGPGFEEVFYQRALHREMVASGLDAAREVDIEVHYKDLVLGKKRVDFVVDQCLVEIKAKALLDDVDVVQTISYLKASGYPVGLLINFGGPKIEIKRLAN